MAIKKCSGLYSETKLPKRYRLRDCLADAIAGRVKEQDVGVYSFWTAGGQCLYIGRSTDLAQRIPGSFREHIPKRRRENIYLRTCVTKTTSDMAVAEMILIAVHKPELNKDSCFDSELTLQVEVPVLSEPTPIGRPSCNANPVLKAKLQRIADDYFD